MTGPFGTTPGPWVYSPHRDTHDSIIHTTTAVEKYGWIDSDNGGIVGSSEWIFIKPEDARAIAQVPAMLELVQAMNEGGFEPIKWVEMARAIARRLEEK